MNKAQKIIEKIDKLIENDNEETDNGEHLDPNRTNHPLHKVLTHHGFKYHHSYEVGTANPHNKNAHIDHAYDNGDRRVFIHSNSKKFSVQHIKDYTKASKRGEGSSELESAIK